MAPLDLDGETLGEKHKHYNKLLKEAIANRQLVSDFALEETDFENLLKIDLACQNRDVDYIIKVFKCGDMLCVSRALAHSTWLVTEPQYAHIINPDYVYTQLQPHMSIRAFNKLYKHIRHNIQDEARAEQFYLYEKILTVAIKWLPYCSATFIETNVKKHTSHLNVKMFRRLSEKSNNIFEIVLQHVQYYSRFEYARAATFLLKVDVDKYLDIFEKQNCFDALPKFNDKATHLIMKNSPKRIIDQFDRYARCIDIPTFSKYIKVDDIKTFLYTQAKKDKANPFQNYYMERFFNYDSLKYFIKRLPKNEQFEFVKKIFIDEEILDAEEESFTAGTEPYDRKILSVAVKKTPSYVWYRFATFQRAFEDLTRIISKDVYNCHKSSMFTFLLSCADRNLEHIRTLLQYFLDHHKNEPYSFMLKFTKELLQHTNVHQYDEKTWCLVNELFKILGVYEESPEHIQVFVETIIIYNILHDQNVPEIIQEHFSFNTLKSYESVLNKEQKEKVFNYLYGILINKFKPILENEDLTNSIEVLMSVLQLIRDWKKQLTDYPFVIDKIKECVKVKKENSWNDSLIPLYNFNKSWRKYLFEESVVMNPCEEVCLNALKHDSKLLERHNTEVEKLQTNDAVLLRRLLAKIRIYWPHSLAQHWTDTFLQNLNGTDGHKASIRGLCSTLPPKPLLQFIEKYKPAQAKIDWNSIDDRVLSIQRFIAKNMHSARPQPCPDTILWYAKGDYLQFALPSLLAIYDNLSITETREHIPKLLDAPVSIQKHGIRIAFRKLDHETIKKIFFDCWKTSKNVSIRAIIFKFTFELLCNEKDPINATSLWELIELFIDNLTFEEDKKIYDILSNVEKVPLNVRAKYLIKSYNFIKSLIQKVKEEDRGQYIAYSSQLAHHSRVIMEDMCPEFVTGLIQEFIDKDFFGTENYFGSIYSSGGMISVISAYLLYAEDVNIQTEKYEKVFVPIMKRAFAMWGEKRNGNYVIRENFQHLLTRLSDDLKEYVAENNMIIPVKMYTDIQNELEKSLTVSENYMMLTKWKLSVDVTKLVDKFNSDTKEWGTIVTELVPEFGQHCLDYLKEDVTSHFSCIYKLFSKALKRIFETVISEDANKVTIYECILSDKDFIQGYLTTIETSYESYNRDKNSYEQVWSQIFAHPSVEVKMHYYNRYQQNRRY